MPNYTQYSGTGVGNADGSTYSFGIADVNAVSGMAVESLSITKTPEFEAEAKNDEGMTAAYVKGDYKSEFSASGYVIDATLFAAVKDFTFDSKFFIIQNKSTSDSNTDFKKCEISGVSYDAILAAPGP